MPKRVSSGQAVVIPPVPPATTSGTTVAPVNTTTSPGDGFDPGKPLRNLPDPKLYGPSAKGAVLTYQRKTGILFVDGANSKDVKQGQLGDCYFLSAVSAWADAHPGDLEQRIKDNGDGTYDITFLQGEAVELDDGSTGWTTTKTVVTVDGELPTEANGTVEYAQSTSKDELWVSLIEKAFAAQSSRGGLLGSGKKDGYPGIGDGGGSNDVFRLLDGKPPMESRFVRGSSKDDLLTLLKNNVDNHVPMTASTPKQLNDGAPNLLIAGHAYSVLDVTEHDGKTWVTLRNPWGWLEPAGDGVDDGRFELELSVFHAQFNTLYE